MFGVVVVALTGFLLQSIHLNAGSGFRDRGLVLPRQVELVLLLKTRALVMLAQRLEVETLLGELLDETALRRNGAGPSGLLVLRTVRHRVGNLTPLECLVEAVELRKNEFAIAGVLGACGVAPALAAALPPARTAARTVLLPADRCSRSAVGVWV